MTPYQQLEKLKAAPHHSTPNHTLTKTNELIESDNEHDTIPSTDTSTS